MRALARPGTAQRTRTVLAVCRDRFEVAAEPQDIEVVELRRLGRVEVHLIRVHGRPRIVEMVEKRTRTKKEARFYEFCAALGPGRDFELAPRVYATRIHRFLPSALFFTATVYIEAIAVRRAPERVPARDLARVAAGIADLDRLRPPLPVSETLTPRDTRSFARAARAAGFAPEVPELAGMEARVAALCASPRFRSIPLIPCHNDVHQANFGFRTGIGAGQPVLIDWSSASYNRAGADLHHWFRRSADPAAAPEYLEALAAYRAALAPRYDVDAGSLDLAAGSYALRRAMTRSRRKRPASRHLFDEAMAIFRRLESAFTGSGDRMHAWIPR